MTLVFLTGNKDKFIEAKSVIPTIEQAEKELIEIQEVNPQSIIEHKLREAMKLFKTNLVVEDTSLEIDGLNGLPGPLIKWFKKSIDNQGIYKLAKAMGNGKAVARVLVGYTKKEGEILFFEGITNGRIVEPRGDKGWGWDPIFLPDGSKKTFGELEVAEKYSMSMRRIAFEKLKSYLASQSLL